MRILFAPLAVLLLSGAAYAQSAAAQPETAPPPPPATNPNAPTLVVPEGCTAVGTPPDITIQCGAQPSAPPRATPESTPAAPPPSYQPAPPTQLREQSKWYGWQTLLVDGGVIATAIVVGAGSSSAGSATTLFTAGYLIGGPIVHWANGQVGKGFASFGIRFGLPLVTGFVGGIIGAKSGGYDGFSSFTGSIAGASLGIFIGGAGAIALDSALLARKTVRVPAHEARRSSPWKLQLQPTGGYDPRTQTLHGGLAGSF